MFETLKELWPVKENKHLWFFLFMSCVSSSAVAVCSVSSTGLNFGDYNVFASFNTDFTGHVSVTCDSLTSYSLLLGAGNGTITDRYMVSSTYKLHYNLYLDAGRTIVWGDGTSAGSVSSGSTSTTDDHIVYGRIPAKQNVHIGSYQDAIIITLQY